MLGDHGHVGALGEGWQAYLQALDPDHLSQAGLRATLEWGGVTTGGRGAARVGAPQACVSDNLHFSLSVGDRRGWVPTKPGRRASLPVSPRRRVGIPLFYVRPGRESHIRKGRDFLLHQEKRVGFLPNVRKWGWGGTTFLFTRIKRQDVPSMFERGFPAPQKRGSTASCFINMSGGLPCVLGGPGLCFLCA